MVTTRVFLLSFLLTCVTVQSLFLSYPSQEDLDSVLEEISDGTITSLEFVELSSDVNVEAIGARDLAYLFSISGGLELTGVDLTETQWSAIAAFSSRDDWSPQWLSIEGMRDMEGLWNSQAEVAVVISNTKQVWLSELELDRWDLWSVDEISEDLLKRCEKLQIWFSRSNFLSLSQEQRAVLNV